MAEEKDKDFINWGKLTEYPVYNASMMKPSPDYESSIIGIVGGTVITPDSSYEDTTKDKDAFTIKVFSRRYTESGTDASINVRMGKEEFTRIMTECVKTKPKKYVWEHPDFHDMFNNCIIGLCARLSALNTGDLFVRSGKPYVLSKGIGFIYNNDIVSGAFSGMILTGKYGSSDGVSTSVSIPKLIHNVNAGNLSNATLVYHDKESNLNITIQGTNLTKDKEDVYTTTSSTRSNSSVIIQKFDPKVNIFCIPEDNFSDLMGKRLRVPMTKFDFRLTGILPTLEVKAVVASQTSTERILNRLTKIGR